jgi:hypothetical protein
VYPGGGSSKIYVGKRDVHILTIQISSSKGATIQTYNTLREWSNSRGSMAGETEITYSGAYIKLDLTNLFSDTVYTITVRGCMDADSGTMETIGTTTFITKS